MEEQDYLIHYGVLGMKWGVRKAEKKGTSYNYTSMKTKRLTKKAAKAKAEGKKNASKISAKAKASKQSDKNRLAYAKKTSVGKAIGQNLLLGPMGALSYQKMRSNGVTRGKALTTQLLAQVASGFAAGLGSHVVTNIAIDQILTQVNAAGAAGLTSASAKQLANQIATQYGAVKAATGAASRALTTTADYIPGNRATTKSAKKKKTKK